VFVVDAGAGKIDVGLLRVENGCVKIIGKNGNPELGGRDFDMCFASFLEKQLSALRIDTLCPTAQAQVHCEVLERCRQAREALSRTPTRQVDMRFHELLSESASPFQFTQQTFKEPKLDELFCKIETLVKELFRTISRKRARSTTFCSLAGFARRPSSDRRFITGLV
jgi:molecular chaperone DnaK (HSP70)